MRRIRFNIASLLVVILALGIGFSALRESNDLWDNALFTLTSGMLAYRTSLNTPKTSSATTFAPSSFGCNSSAKCSS